MQRLTNPRPIFLDGFGALVDAGYVYYGVADADPVTDPISVFLDQDLTIPIEQPLRTLGGVIVNGETPVFVYCAEADYSMLVQDANQVQVDYVASATVSASGPSYQPLSDTLTALAALITTAYGRAFLSLVNQAGLQALVGTPATLLAKAGGTMSGDISRSGAGVYVYHNDSSLTSGRIFVTDAGAADPTSQPGDIWLEKQ